ncbi:MAG: aldehyde dehydrogenase family protein [Gammaproteobacteria bacterium]|nr:aldehyde dehydrogenase family protein [Gammaproteobacteria bacterium]
MNSAVVPQITGVQTQTACISELFARQGETAIRLRTSTAAERLAKIDRLKVAVLARAQALREAGAEDFRKPPAEVDLAEILPVVAEANEARRKLKKWMRPQRVRPTRAMFGTRGWIQYQPKGRCLIISPWNYPVNLTFGPLISAIAAGNTAILKPSELTPNLSRVMAELVRETFPGDEIALFEGDATVAQALLELPFDHIFFTGSPAIGKQVMTAAAKHLASVTLELGGKSPTIIDAGADLDAAARNILWSKFTNDGQTCIAPDHIYVHTSIKDAFVARCREVLETTYGAESPQQLQGPDLARIVNARHTVRIKALLEDARARGARVLTGGFVDESQRFIAPTLLGDIPDDAAIMREEIFGPLLPIIGFSDIGEAIRRINAGPKPLALYLWSKDQAIVDRVLAQTSSGGACINHTVVQFLHGNLPFGGVNNSGIGNAHGHWGFKAFSHERAVVRSQLMLAKMFYPPYTERMRWIVDKMIRFGV